MTIIEFIATVVTIIWLVATHAVFVDQEWVWGRLAYRAVFWSLALFTLYFFLKAVGLLLDLIRTGVPT